MIKRGKYDHNMKAQPTDPKHRILFYQQDPIGYVNAADPDLREPGDRPMPWRRVYGFAQNSHLLDRGFLFGSSIVILIWIIWPPNLSHVMGVYNYLESSEPVWQVGYAAIFLLFAAGETQRRDKVPKLPFLKPLQVPMFIGGLLLLAAWFELFSDKIYMNIQNIFMDPVPILAAAIAVPVTAFIVIRFYTRGGRTTVV